MSDREWPIGQAIEKARERAGLSKRAAALAAGISEGRWRQITDGFQRVGGQEVPVNTRPETVVRMATAVGLDVDRALELAGFPPRATADTGLSTPIVGTGVDPDVLADLRPEEVQRVLDFVEGIKAGRGTGN